MVELVSQEVGVEIRFGFGVVFCCVFFSVREMMKDNETKNMGIIIGVRNYSSSAGEKSL